MIADATGTNTGARHEPYMPTSSPSLLLAATCALGACHIDSNVGVAGNPTDDAGTDGQPDPTADADPDVAGTWRIQEVFGEYAPRDIWGSAANDAWVVGTGGALLHWDGTGFFGSVAPSTLVNLDGVWVANSAVAYAVGDTSTGTDHVWQWNGTAWSAKTTPADGAMTGIWGLAGSTIQTWSVGHAFNFQYQASPDQPWVRKSGMGTPYLSEDVWTSGLDDNVWLVGLTGITKFDRTTEQFTTQPVAGRFRGVHGNAANDVWAVGEDGAIAHWDGNAWALVASNVTTHLRAVWASSATNAWAVGDDATIVRWDGTAWAQVAHGLATTDDLHGIWGASGSNVFAVGGQQTSGVVLRYSP